MIVVEKLHKTKKYKKTRNSVKKSKIYKIDTMKLKDACSLEEKL